MSRRLQMQELWSRRGAVLCLAAAIVASAALLLSLDSHLTFIADDWELLVGRRGWSPGAFLDPFHEHIVLAPALIYRALLSLFGMDSALPFFVVSIGLFALSAALLFAYLRPRVGEWLALLFVVVVLFLGAASEDLLWAFQMGLFGSMAAGLGMLLALDRGDGRGDRLACVLLLVSMAFSSLGVAFAAAALVDLGLGRRPRAKRAYIASVPIAAFALWWIGWGHAAESHISLHNLLTLPMYVFDAIGAGAAALLGREVVDQSRPGHPPLLFLGLAAVALLVGVARIFRERRVSRGLAIALALGLAFWVLAGLNRYWLRPPTASRYQYPSAVFLLLIAAEMLKGVRISRLVTGLIAVLAAVSVLGGLSLLRREERLWRNMANTTRSTLAAIDLAGEQAGGGFPVSTLGPTVFPARDYVEVAKEYGSPAYEEGELLEQPASRGSVVDPILAGILGISLKAPLPHGLRPSCKEIWASRSPSRAVALPPGTFALTNISAKTVGIVIGRFAIATSVNLGSLAPEEARSLSIPRDGAPRRWRLSVRGNGPVRLCTTEPG